MKPDRIAPQPAINTVLAVPGMHCAGCMAKVERALSARPGVTQARVNLSARTVSVAHDPALDENDLVATLSNIGFEAQPREEGPGAGPSELRALLAPLAVAAFAAMNVMLLSVSIWSGADPSTRSLFHWISALIAIPAIAYAGRPFFASALKVLRKGRTNMDVPISLGVLIASGLSLYETIVGGTHAWFDGALMLLAFLLAGRVLDAMMRDRARAGVDALVRQAAQGATVVAPDGSCTWVRAEELVPGMVMRVAVGERVAADGELVAGHSRFDQSLLTGESAPVVMGPGAELVSGSLNIGAPVDIRVTRIGSESALAEIARLMDAASQSRSRYVRIADRAARLYAPAVHTMAALAFVGWLVAGSGVYQALVVAVAVLIITCPCALGLAVPVAQVVASGAMMRAGLMVKDGSALERLATIDRALLDKTGTLTLGRPVPDPAALAALPPETASVALALASHSRHPLSRALAAALAREGVHAATLSDVTERAGEGVFARHLGLAVALRRPESAGGVAVALQIEGEPIRLISFADALRPDAARALAELKALGIECSILSGDNVGAVSTVSHAVGLMAQAGAKPADKQDTIRRLQAGGRRVLMVGDGLNDGPALACADASMAPGSASDVGRQAADIVFLTESLAALPRAVRAARATRAIVRQNFALAIGYNALAVPLAMAGLLTPLIAAAAMSMSSLIVVGNSLRLARAAR